jgi:flagellar protein FlaG
MNMSAIDNLATPVDDAIRTVVPASVPKSPSPNMDAKVMHQVPSQTATTHVALPGRASAIDQSVVDKLIEKLSQQFQSRNTSLSFSIDEKTRALVVKVIDSESEKVIRQIPPEEMLAIRERIQQILGALIDKEA